MNGAIASDLMVLQAQTLRETLEVEGIVKRLIEEHEALRRQLEANGDALREAWADFRKVRGQAEHFAGLLRLHAGIDPWASYHERFKNDEAFRKRFS